MKRYSLLLLSAILLASNACERHPVGDLKLIEESKEEGVRPEPKRDTPQLATPAPGKSLDSTQ